MTALSNRVLVVDDELTIRSVLQRKLQREGCEASALGTAEQALEFVREHHPSVVLMDIVLPGTNGIDALGEIKKISPDTEVLIMTSHASVETAIGAIREGAYDYLQKPFDDLDQVWLSVRRALERRTLAIRNRSLAAEQKRRNDELAASVARLTSMVAASHAMSDLDSLQGLLDYFIEFVTAALSVDRASLMLLDEDTKELWIAAHRGLEDVDSDAVRVALGHGVAGNVAQAGTALLVEDSGADPRVPSPSADLSSSFLSAPIVLSVPLKSSRRMLGVVNLTNRRSGEPFDQGDLSYLQTLSNHLAVAIERTRNLEELRQAYASLKSTQDQLVFSERLKAVGQMAAGVAHDVNNLLSVISGKAELGRTRLKDENSPDAAALHAVLETISKAALQGSRVVERILSFTRTCDLNRESVFELDDVVRAAIEMTRPKWKDEPEANNSQIRLETRLAGPARVAGNTHELVQALANLVFNAVEAMPEGGTLRIASRVEDDKAVIEIEDTGVGMDKETEARLFEPFFTTKTTGQGLGMCILHGIVRRHGGRIGVHSVPGQGTAFILKLPLASEQLEEPRNEATAPRPEPRSARVLLVDDDHLVRETFQEALNIAGHQVMACSSGKQALKLSETTDCDAVITDLGMAGMSGLELARKLKNANPQLPIILFSGWGGEFIDHKVENSAIDFVLQKPCMIDRLLRTLQDALAQHVPR